MILYDRHASMKVTMCDISDPIFMRHKHTLYLHKSISLEPGSLLSFLLTRVGLVSSSSHDMVLELRPRRLVFLVIAATMLALYTIADSFLFHQRDVQACQMSYSRPSFRRLPVTSRLSNKYKMYLYREGGLDDPNKVRHAFRQ